MNDPKFKELLESLRQQTESLLYNDTVNLDALKKRAAMLVKKIFSEDSSYLNTLNRIRFSPTIAFSSMPDSIYHKAWNSGQKQLINLINTMLEDLEITAFDQGENNTKNGRSELSNNIFIVHGRNEEMKQAVARMLEKLSLKPIILHEQPNNGRTIIEKFSDHSNVGFAVALLSADDVGYPIEDKPANAKLRARQNVIFELGFFLGKLGREKVVVLFDDTNNFEFPSDYNGVIYIPYDKSNRWQFDILKELKERGYEVDANKLL